MQKWLQHRASCRKRRRPPLLCCKYHLYFIFHSSQSLLKLGYFVIYFILFLSDTQRSSASFTTPVYNETRPLLPFIVFHSRHQTLLALLLLNSEAMYSHALHRAASFSDAEASDLGGTSIHLSHMLHKSVLCRI